MTAGVGRLHVLTDARGGPAALDAVAAAVAAGAPVVQVRHKDCTDRALYAFAARVVEICAPADATCIVNDRVDIAVAVGADGTHLGADDLPVGAARRVAGPGHLLGGTARYLFVVDNHYTRGGQADLIARGLLELAPTRMPRFRGIGLTEIPRCGTEDEALTAHGLHADNLAQVIRDDVRKEDRIDTAQRA